MSNEYINHVLDLVEKYGELQSEFTLWVVSHDHCIEETKRIAEEECRIIADIVDLLQRV